MHKEVLLDQVTLCADGSIGIKLNKRIIDDDGSVFFTEPHRTSVDVLGEVSDQIALVNAHLNGLGFPAVPDAALAKISALTNLHRADPAVQDRRETTRLIREALAEQAAAEQAT